MKCVVSLRYDFCVCAIGCSNLSTNDDSLSVGPSQPEMIGLPTGFGLWNFFFFFFFFFFFVDFSKGIEYRDSWGIACL